MLPHLHYAAKNGEAPRPDITSFLSMIGLPHNSLHARLLAHAARLEEERARSVTYAPLGFGKRYLLSILDELAIERDPSISLEPSAPRRMIAAVSADLIRSLKGVRGRFGVEPERLPDLLALAGDKSDGYPGVPNIGVDAPLPVPLDGCLC